MVARILAKELGYLLVDRKNIVDALKEMGLPPQLIRFDENAGGTEEEEKKRRYYITALHDYLIGLAAKQSIVLIGRGGQFLFRDRPDAFHILVIAPFSQRAQWIREIYKLERKAANMLVREHDRRKKRYIRQVFDRLWLDADYYDLVLNTKKLTPQGAAALARQAVSLFLENRTPEPDTVGMKEIHNQKDVSFMHPSEAEFARVLDFYNLRWEYEPRTFPLQWDGDGRVTEAFAPDFYLPDQDLYVELTTQRQKLVWKKNKKIRRLKELYPDINVKIIYNSDFHSFLEAFGVER